MNFASSKKIVLTAALALFVLLQAKSVFALTLTPIRLEVSGEAGTVLHEEMTLINERATDQTFYSSYANFEAQGETGTPTFVDAHDDLGTWMQAPASVSLKAGESKIVPFTITIPKGAEAGGHFAALFWGTTPSNTTTSQVSIGAKVGTLVLLRVNGTITESGGILDFTTKAKQVFFTSRPVTFHYRFENSGVDRIKPTGSVVIKNSIGLTTTSVTANTTEGNILPRSIRKFETVWQGKDGSDLGDTMHEGYFGAVKREWRNFAFGYYRAYIDISYGTKNEHAQSMTSFWVFPWQLLLLIVILACVGLFGGRIAIRRYNQWVIAQATKILQQQNLQREKDTHPTI
jgi:hypothetical protein